MYTFNDLVKCFQENFAKVIDNGTRPLFVVAGDKDALWNLYLDSYPKGTNPIYRVRREYDCSCCRHFLKDMVNVVYIDDDMHVHSIFEFSTGSDIYQPSMDAIAKAVVRQPIIEPFLRYDASVGVELSRELSGNGSVTTYHHFNLVLPQKYYIRTPGCSQHSQDEG